MTDPIVDGGTPTGLPAPSEVETTTTKIILAAKHQLQDLLPPGTIVDQDKWSIDETLLPYLNLGIVEIINLKPEAYTVVENLTLVAGAAQGLTGATYVALIKPVCDMGTGGATVGNTIDSIEKKKMDDFVPNWMTATAAAVPIFLVLDRDTPKVFYTYPPQTGTPTKVKAVVSKIPTLLTALSDAFPLDDSYKPAAVDYLIYRCLSEETVIPNALNKANMFYQRFLQGLGLKTNIERQTVEERK